MRSPVERVMRWRSKRQYTQEEVAKLLGVSRAYIARLESGRCKLNVKLAKAYAEHMGCKWYTLIG
jgi:DNA-binding XRE family transcriptional regulator